MSGFPKSGPGGLQSKSAPVLSVTIMKASGVKVMKRATKPCRREKGKSKAYSTYIYRIQKEGDSASKFTRVPRSLSGEAFQLVVSEAARLSKCNKRGTITRQEVHLAVEFLRPKRNSGEEGA
ncbi:hypothetical protein AAFF_G00278110 [Aldrovandia affinis]|uniref:Uncharacterized protein n=1 Tax=Aldrovandia affinis TaxID=143900 RepID=A0AAD7SQZ0_9TELE|nr:hypothetical protein AAFF_G00278110 [Aldrovandia affinis]